MMFQKFKDNQKETLCILRPDGTLSELASRAQFLSDEKILEAYRLMVLARQADEWAVSLKQHPLLNTWYREEEQVLDQRDEINVGFALDSAEGLVVPVIEAADRLTLSEIQEQINLRREESSTRTLQLDVLRGGTFTVSNYGSIGGTYGRPMILPPQVAILGLGRIHQAPIAKGGELAVGTILPLSFVFDHRVCDGAYAVRFLNTFIELVTKPIRILR